MARRELGAVRRPSMVARKLLLGAVAVLCALSACEEEQQRSAPEVIGIRLVAAKGLPHLEIRTFAEPKISAAKLAKGVSSLMAKARTACADPLNKSDAKAFPLELRFTVVRGRVASSKKEKPGTLAGCLLGAIRGQKLDGWTQKKISVGAQLMRQAAQ